MCPNTPVDGFLSLINQGRAFDALDLVIHCRVSITSINTTTQTNCAPFPREQRIALLSSLLEKIAPIRGGVHAKQTRSNILTCSKIRRKERSTTSTSTVQSAHSHRSESERRTKAVNSCWVLGGGGLVRRAVHART